ncbi:MAG TPA: membrane protein insertion efficiency factor YidD [Alphaproteobacteria bacterium]|nr:membrane protein insertion efficiency factor YidD [Alphaproteobacteria bacterium]
MILRAILLFFIQLYRWIISPAQVFLFGGGCGCRFTPTCSQYAAEAIRRHGALAGSVMAIGRICRCHPLGGCGDDPVPTRPESEAPLISHG